MKHMGKRFSKKFEYYPVRKKEYLSTRDGLLEMNTG